MYHAVLLRILSEVAVSVWPSNTIHLSTRHVESARWATATVNTSAKIHISSLPSSSTTRGNNNCISDVVGRSCVRHTVGATVTTNPIILWTNEIRFHDAWWFTSKPRYVICHTRCIECDDYPHSSQCGITKSDEGANDWLVNGLHLMAFKHAQDKQWWTKKRNRKRCGCSTVDSIHFLTTGEWRMNMASRDTRPHHKSHMCASEAPFHFCFRQFLFYLRTEIDVTVQIVT